MRRILPLLFVNLACGEAPLCGGAECRIYGPPDGNILEPDGGLASDSGLDAGLRVDSGTTPDVGSPPPAELDLNDVSFLIPLADPAALWAVDTVVDGRRLIEESWATNTFPPFEDLNGGVPAREERIHHFQIVGVRVDHCFPGQAPLPSCRRQIRLVAQPIQVFVGVPLAHDSAAHLLYDLDDTAWSELQVGLRELRALANGRTRGQPLTVHPVLATEGLNGPYGQRLFRLVRRLAHSDALSQVATMNGNGAAWSFEATDRVGGLAVHNPIPRLGSEVVQRSTQPTIGTGLEGYDVDPAPTGDDALAYFYRGAAFLEDPAARVVERFQAAQALLDPAQSSPATHDCVSCHVAHFALHQAARRRADVLSALPPAFTAPGFDLRRLDPNLERAESFRAFGYFGSDPAITARVSAESAVVALALAESDGRR
ncbi:MAG: hypothetical protein IPG45_31910 [Deltaproteobacteria bacterium]|nr:hypothetical protein [Deltaproteobacteria bacterium]